MAVDIIQTLASYVPQVVSQRLADDPTPITIPRSETFPAALLFADISGFTALAERLAHQGPAGAEELSYLLNAYFGQLIDLIIAQGGDIVKFAGDALIALWPAADESHLGQAIHKAAYCGLQAQKKLNAYAVTEDITLSLKVAIGAGEILTMHLGGLLKRWEFIVTGDPLVQVGTIDKHLEKGEVILSPEAWTFLHRNAAGTVLPLSLSSTTPEAIRLKSLRLSPVVEAAPAPPLSADTETGLRAYIPGAILARLGLHKSDWLAELRRVTVLFVNLPRLDYHLPIDQAQQIMQTLQKAIYRYEGSVNKLSVDDKGVTFIAAMGLPPLSHEDDSLRGVQAALDIYSVLQEMNVGCSIGITTGRAFCGVIGNEQRREYTMIGDIVNLSARLMQNAQGGILCDAATHRKIHAASNLELRLGVDLDDSGGVGDLPHFEPLPPITVKGKSQPITVYRPEHRTTTTPHLEPQRASMVGRQAERQLLETKLTALEQHQQGGIIIIEGDAGLGKSRLVEELILQTRTTRIVTLIGAGLATDKSTLYHSWRPVFKQLFEFQNASDDVAARRMWVLDRLDAELVTLAPLLDAVLSLDWPENALTAQMVGKVRADNTRDLLVKILQQAVRHTKTPHLLILEDAHWLDSASWSLVQQVAEHVQPLLLVIATRPMAAQAPTEYHYLRNVPGTHLLELTSLSPEDTMTLVCQRLGVSQLPEPLLDLIQQKAGGNPFFSEEIVYSLRDANLITVADGQCHLAPEAGDVNALDLPDTIQGIITSRIDRLSPAQQMTLKVASVIGRVFEFEALHAIHPTEPEPQHLLTHLDHLNHLDIALMDTPDPHLAYIFKHILTQEVAYNLLLYAQRRELHQAVATWYETTYADDLTPYYALLAYHWYAGAFTEQAVAYLVKAGEQALDNYVNEEAIQFFTQALSLDMNQGETASHAYTHPSDLPADVLAQTLPRWGRWEIKLGEAYVNWVKFGEGRIHLEQGLRLFGYPIPQKNVGLVWGLLGQIGRQVANRLGAKRAPQTPDPTLLEAARAYEGLTAVYYFANDKLRTLYAAIRSLNLAEAAGPSAELARGYASVGVIISFIPLPNLAEAYCRWALTMADQLDNNLSARAWVSLLVGIYHAGVGHWHTAEDLLSEVIGWSAYLGDHSRWDDGTGNLAAVAYFKGNSETASRLHHDLLESARRRHDTHNEAWALRGQVYCLLAKGHFDEALTRLQRLETLLAQEAHLVDEPLTIDMHSLLALTYLRLGKPELALQAADNALAMMVTTSPTSFLSLPGYAAMVETHLTLYETAPNLRQQAWKSCRMLYDYARVFPIGRAQAALWHGVFEWIAGRPKRAQKFWQRGLQAAQRFQMPYVEALIHYHWGHRLPPDNPERLVHLSQAEAIFERLGAPTLDPVPVDSVP